jgi:hypothetical protein
MKSVFVVIVVVLVGLIAANAYAWRAPTKTERIGIVTAIHDNQRHNDCHSYRTCHPHISDIRVSLANTSYASAMLHVRGYDDVLAVLHKLYGSWHVTAAGTSQYVGCGKAPKAVRVDLDLWCPPGGK